MSINRIVAAILLGTAMASWAQPVRGQSPRTLYTWEGTGDAVNWFKQFGANDVTIANDIAGELTITEIGTSGAPVAVSDGFNTISESAASVVAGGIDLTGLDSIEFDLGHNGVGSVSVQFFAQVDPGSTFVALGDDQLVSPGLATYSAPLSGLQPDQSAYVRTVGINVRDHAILGNLIWTLQEVRSAGTPLSLRDIATHNPGSSDNGLQGAIVNFDNAAVQGNDGGQNQSGLSQNLTGQPAGNSGSLQWTDLSGGGGGAVSWGNGTVFQGNTFNERPTDLSNYTAVRVRMAAANVGGNVPEVDVQYFLQTGGGFTFEAAGIKSLPADGEFHTLAFPVASISARDIVMQHGVNLDEHPDGNLLIDVDNVRYVLVGDMDCDSDIDFDDIDDFVLGLNDPTEYESIFGVPTAAKGDTDLDGDQDFDDIEQFVSILTGGSQMAVPEPSTALLTALALLAASGRLILRGQPRT